ncbi:alpha-L-fucosidase [Mucilaginibacter gracilis]|uniref:alpha-L-fucosidase n=1 Tax=Mucilaginibacter gracilis TaxID=423350 RepID=A0A495ITY2_9SPHI|nr:alpha-L-fucosidase [Mucilaginibacter gracilis]RKR80130.1 alpha-L-fucosidase [Mucilaginibacter gracilis]
MEISKKLFNKTALIFVLSLATVQGAMAQQAKANKEEANRIKMEHDQIGITEDKKSGYTHTTNAGAQWFPQADFGLFIHWSIASIKEVDLSWPMMAGTQIGWTRPMPDSAMVAKFIKDGDYFAGHHCEVDNSCLTPNQYWEQAKDFNPQSYDADKWIKAAKEAGMVYAVLTTRHHDGFAMWPSRYGNFNTKNYMGGRDLVKEFVAACHKYGIKVGLYYSGPDWYFNKDYQSFMYYGVGKNYPNIPELDANLKPRTTTRTAEEKQVHYEAVAAYIKGQVQELLTNYGKVDMIWFDGSPDIPKGNPAWKNCITMEQIHQLQPGIVVSPRFFGYGDYKTFEGDKSVPTTKQDGWAELCMTSANGWGYTKSPLKTTAYMLDKLVNCRALNTNLLLNFGPDKTGVFNSQQYQRFAEIAAWMKVNGEAVRGTAAINAAEYSSVPATAKDKYRYIFLSPNAKGADAKDETITFKTTANPKNVKMLLGDTKLNYKVQNGLISVTVPGKLRSQSVGVVAIEL